ncbi:MAG: type II secretion system F family protein [Piscirickettsiaceae bacterium CG_4_9_14_3_um_filter_43_564]|nr:type II secretion system F family protein [Thiomicrospira sp.]OIP96777.1 MAG: type II secretion system protein [Thiomicrospira sp. CG2_30_44_34]PIQ04671.1 MAG: type II secretion system protein [Piscirickettsiaceae bacterium CG18_big_fil_WC_8_21_14_2_50_44_103]PIU39391.1 MAG: type II secretion system F family protein [Piscirickettsiaceae bacterium CG07_land_8_20_14_0_80_44_28]PIW56772.1 MAG: type II secretion system F family protein [Piscirickettsiaceae bacterium CG12_big_fil_rev_8_21_14_0_65
MPNYQYQGINQQGKRVRGEMQAANELDLEQRLREAHIEIIALKEKSTLFHFSFKRKVVKRRDLIILTSQFRQLLKAGVPLMDILDDLKRTYENVAVREIVASIYESMEGGAEFAEALREHEKIFGKVYISLVAVGEKTGQLDQVLSNLESMLKWEESLVSKAKKVMIYPAIVGTVVLSVVMLLMLFVVPELLGFIKEMGGELSFATTSLIATSNFVQHHILEMLLFPFIVVFILKWWLKKSTQFRVQFDGFIFKLPVIGKVLYNLKIARFASALAVMYRAGMNFNASMRLASVVTENADLEQRINESIRLIEEGEMIYKAYTQTEFFPSMAIRMVKVGEQSGNMDDALHNVSEYYEQEAKDMIDKIEPAIEPLLTVIMAIVVGWVMMAVLGPVYDTISQVT